MVQQAERSEETKRKLLDAARDLIVECGWSSVSNRAISERAGVNLALISYHFGGKKKLLSMMLDRAVREITDAYTPSDDGNDLNGFLSSAIEVVPGLAQDPNVRVLAVALLEATFDEELAVAVRRNLSALREQIEGIVIESGVSRAKSKGLSTALAALLDGILIHFLLDPKTDIQGAAKSISDLL